MADAPVTRRATRHEPVLLTAAFASALIILRGTRL